MSAVTLRQKLEGIMDCLRAPDQIEMAAIISRDGLIIATDTNQNHNNLTTRTLAALTATLNMSAETTIKRLSGKTPQSIIVETPARTHSWSYSPQQKKTSRNATQNKKGGRRGKTARITHFTHRARPIRHQF